MLQMCTLHCHHLASCYYLFYCAVKFKNWFSSINALASFLLIRFWHTYLAELPDLEENAVVIFCGGKPSYTHFHSTDLCKEHVDMQLKISTSVPPPIQFSCPSYVSTGLYWQLQICGPALSNLFLKCGPSKQLIG